MKITLSKYLKSGADRDRTDDLMNAIHALSQLSYGPKLFMNLTFSSLYQTV